MQGRFRSFDFWDGVVFGVAVSTIAALMAVIVFGAFPRELWSVLATLASVPIAAIAAWIALSATRYQINHARIQDLEATKAVLPLALSRAISVAKNGMAYASGSAVGTRQQIEEALSLDDSVIGTFRDCIRAADPVTREWLKVLIARYQVYHARMDWWCQSAAPANNGGLLSLVPEREDAIMDWATFHALVEHFYPFARGMTESVPRRLDGTRLRSAYFLHLFHLGFHPTFQARIDKRNERLADGDIEHFRFHD